jgi:transcriptional regulator with XRE-family HTH domain
MTFPATATRRQPDYIDFRRLPPALAAELRSARVSRGLSLRRAARSAGIPAGYMSRLEGGHRAPRIGVAERLIQVLQLDPRITDWLLDQVAPEREEGSR